MICPKCDSANTWVFRTLTGPAVSRQHACISCAVTWWSDARPRQGSFVENGAKDMNAKRLTHICVTGEPTGQKEKSDLVLSDPESASSRQSDAPAMETTQFQFPVVGGTKVWFAPKARDTEWRTAFPGIDVTAQYRLAYAWLQSNPTKRKTPRGMSHFLFGWLERAQNAPKPKAQDDRCFFHRAPGTLRRRPPMGWQDACPECKHARAGGGTRTGEPATVTDLVASTEKRLADARALVPATREQLEELRTGGVR